MHIMTITVRTLDGKVTGESGHHKPTVNRSKKRLLSVHGKEDSLSRPSVSG